MKYSIFDKYAPLVRRDFRSLEKHILDTAKKCNLKRERIARLKFDTKHYNLYRLTTDNSGIDVCIISGIHGDEYEGVFALLEFLKSLKRKDFERFNLDIFPIVNPISYTLGKREIGPAFNDSFGKKYAPLEIKVIENCLKKHYALSIDIHGDNESTGFAIFERKRKKIKSLAAKIIARMKNKFEIDKDPKVDNADNTVCVNRGGVLKSSYTRENTLESYMFKRDKKILYSLTLEHPGNKESLGEISTFSYIALKLSFQEFWKIMRNFQ